MRKVRLIADTFVHSHSRVPQPKIRVDLHFLEKLLRENLVFRRIAHEIAQASGFKSESLRRPERKEHLREAYHVYLAEMNLK
jgi:hypothetical protein